MIKEEKAGGFYIDIYYGNAVLGLLHYIALAKLFSNEIKI